MIQLNCPLWWSQYFNDARAYKSAKERGKCTLRHIMMKLNQNYINIVGGVLILVLGSIITAGGGIVAKMHATVNKADLAISKIENNETEDKRNKKVLHRRISDNEVSIRKAKELVIEVDERSKIILQYLMRMR